MPNDKSTTSLHRALLTVWGAMVCVWHTRTLTSEGINWKRDSSRHATFSQSSKTQPKFSRDNVSSRCQWVVKNSGTLIILSASTHGDQITLVSPLSQVFVTSGTNSWCQVTRSCFFAYLYNSDQTSLVAIIQHQWAATSLSLMSRNASNVVLMVHRRHFEAIEVECPNDFQNHMSLSSRGNYHPAIKRHNFRHFPIIMVHDVLLHSQNSLTTHSYSLTALQLFRIVRPVFCDVTTPPTNFLLSYHNF